MDGPWVSSTVLDGDKITALVGQGFIPSKLDPLKYYRPQMSLATHVDDVITRGHSHTTAAFWAALQKRFDVKEWGIVEEDSPQVYCAKRVSKVNKAGKTWYSVD